MWANILASMDSRSQTWTGQSLDQLFLSHMVDTTDGTNSMVTCSDDDNTGYQTCLYWSLIEISDRLQNIAKHKLLLRNAARIGYDVGIICGYDFQEQVSFHKAMTTHWNIVVVFPAAIRRQRGNRLLSLTLVCYTYFVTYLLRWVNIHPLLKSNCYFIL